MNQNSLRGPAWFHYKVSDSVPMVEPPWGPTNYPFAKQALVFMCMQYKSFENTVGKGEIARNEQFLLFPQCFLPVWRTLCHFYQIWNCRLQTLLVWKSLKFVVWEKAYFMGVSLREALQILSLVLMKPMNTQIFVMSHYVTERISKAS